MRKFILSTLVSLFISACGGGGSSTPAPSFSFTPGIYTGTFTPAGGAADVFAIIIASNGSWAGVDFEEGATGTYSGATLTDPSLTATLTATSSGTYTSNGISGTFTLVDAGIYNRPANLSKLAGTWIDTTFTQNTGTMTHTIDGSGNITSTSVSGCASSGTINTIDTTKNEYTISLTVTNCGGFNGVYTGLALLDDTTITEDTLVYLADNDILDTFTLSSAIKQ